VQELLAQAKPAEAILERRPDLIMMPTRGESSFQARVMGSVTMAVLHDAECPVWTTAHAGDAPGERCRRILCALDLSAHSIDTLRWLAMVKRRFGAEARLVHCVPSVASRFDSGAAERAHHFLVWNARDKYPALAAEAGLSEPIEILESPGAVAESISAEAGRYGADLLIAGRGAVRGVLGRLRSNAQELIHTSPCPVLSV
jgi:nucleotide-binding universal stress UspA family protein